MIRDNWKRYIPMFLFLFLIFGLTFQNCRKSVDLTIAVQKLINRIVNTNQGEHWWDNYKLLRRFAHIPEYFLLGIGSFYALRSWRKATFFCVGISFADEIVKGFLPGREFDLVDMGFDLIGYSIGILAMSVVLKIYSLIDSDKNSTYEINK